MGDQGFPALPCPRPEPRILVVLPARLSLLDRDVESQSAAGRGGFVGFLLWLYLHPIK